MLTKINRIDIVTLLEGPIFDYGNISGTRSFADENNGFHDPVDGNGGLLLFFCNIPLGSLSFLLIHVENGLFF